MLVSSNPISRGTKAPDFALPDTISDKILRLNDVKGDRATVIFFICNHCPFVVHVNSELVKLAHDYQNLGIGFVAISSNNVNHVPQDGPEQMKRHAANVGYSFPYLYDESQAVAKAYQAACTPDFYVFDAELKSVYHGQLDDSRPGNGKPITGSDIRNTLNTLLRGEAVTGLEKPSIGCNIKWK